MLVGPLDGIQIPAPKTLPNRPAVREMTKRTDYRRERSDFLSVVCEGREGPLAARPDEECGFLLV